MYLQLKYLHVSCVVLSGIGFVLRGLWMIAESPMLSRRWVRVAPHVVDTLLLGSAITMVVISSQFPFAKGWLTAKLIGLVVYILCGTMALKRGRTKVVRIAFFLAALLAYAYIISVALSRNPQGFFS
ncbi:SirB2 family protein [Propionivibrio sp.]|uniref:SirB2 family protein n=1 Tax=Propionivibrio sp. TaxID=2212460 RepID=UPI0025F3081D|nr:SirB2 family protein [Propionivibrio sp.]MBK7356439.1 SirB2 family protein [Propionivibrio sp.]MBK8400094.1 SirB2 family protein [Propionivibrio sp.]MBK8744664.1 SirB2 family protein [Propionivibrio sp.]MBK8893784.1 SirB2 family protein [Propionivibrio sp.]MBL0207912.1 SirB2 family protein [Propionivibrio sp.]